MHATARLSSFATGFTPGQRRLARAGFAIFLLLGAAQALYGPTLPSVRTAFGLSTATAGWTIGIHYSGSVAGVLLSFLLQARLRASSRLAVGVVLVALGAVSFAVIHAWPWALAGVLCIGLGYGILVVVVNTLVAAGFGDRSGALLILVNSAFGLGAVAGPLLYGLVCSGSFRPAFLVVGILTAFILPLAWAVPTRTAHEPQATAETHGGFPLALAGFVFLFLLYTALETDTGGWMATNLVFHGYSQAAAAGLTAAFWGALTVGRLLSIPISLRLSSLQMIAGALLGVIVLALAANVAMLTAIAYISIGLLLAPIFPLAFGWMDLALPGARGAASFALLGALAGGLIFPLAVGRIIGATTPDVLPLALTALAALCLIVSLCLPRLIRGARTSTRGLEEHSKEACQSVS